MAIAGQSDAHWQGDSQTGIGQFRLGNGLLASACSFISRRVMGRRDANPEDLLAAACSDCFTREIL